MDSTQVPTGRLAPSPETPNGVVFILGRPDRAYKPPGMARSFYIQTATLIRVSQNDNWLYDSLVNYLRVTTNDSRFQLATRDALANG